MPSVNTTPVKKRGRPKGSKNKRIITLSKMKKQKQYPTFSVNMKIPEAPRQKMTMIERFRTTFSKSKTSLQTQIPTLPSNPPSNPPQIPAQVRYLQTLHSNPTAPNPIPQMHFPQPRYKPTPIRLPLTTTTTPTTATTTTTPITTTTHPSYAMSSHRGVMCAMYVEDPFCLFMA